MLVQHISPLGQGKISTQSTEKPVAHQNAVAYIPRSVSGKRAGPKRAQAAPAFFIGKLITAKRPAWVRFCDV
jgi:hypothetical protein